MRSAPGRSSADDFVSIGVVGLALSIAAITVAIALDRAYRDLRYLYLLAAWPLFSLLMSFVVVRALFLEVSGAPARWNKFSRTGVVSRPQPHGSPRR